MGDAVKVMRGVWRPVSLLVVVCGAGSLSCQRAAPPAPPMAQAAPRAALVMSGDGTHIHYEVYGSGPPLLVINGAFGQDSTGYDTLARLLAGAHQVVLFDRRGTGRSPIADMRNEDVSFALMAADIEAIRNALGHTQWSVLGHSFGGMLASYYVTEHPERVDRLVLSSSSGVDQALFDEDPRTHIHARLTEDDRSELLEIEARHADGLTTAAELERFTHILSRAYVYDDVHTDWVVTRLQGQQQEVGRLVTEDMRRIEFDCKPGLAEFQRPTLILQGDADVFPSAISERALQILPRATLVTLPETGHYGWIEHPELYRDTVLDFLAQ